MYDYRIEVEISSVRQDTCEVLVVAEDEVGQTCVVDAQTTHWPPWAREWRPMMDAARKWLDESAGSR